jgi:predicted site-specific integrase-resolvase
MKNRGFSLIYYPPERRLMSEYLGTTATALRLGVSAVYVRVLEREGKLKAALKTTDGVRVFRSEDVERLAAERQKREKQKRSSTKEKAKEAA